MSENIDGMHVPCDEDNEDNVVCGICEDLPKYAAKYLQDREKQKTGLIHEGSQNADVMLLKFYYALLHLLDEIHERTVCPNLDSTVPKSRDTKCPNPEYFVRYRYIYNLYATILKSEMGFSKGCLQCDICTVLPYFILSDLEDIAKNLHVDYIKKERKLVLCNN